MIATGRVATLALALAEMFEEEMLNGDYSQTTIKPE